MPRKTSLHTKYRTKSGDRVPSVTTIIGGNLGWNKNVLIAWAKRTAMEGEDPDAVKQEAADIGTLAHAMIEEYIISQAPHLETDDPIDRNQYSGEQLEKAELAFNAFLEWSNAHNPDYSDPRTATETYMVSEWMRFGGTIDFTVVLDGKLSVVDFKTSKAVYTDHRIQLAAYQYLVRENLLSGGEGDIPTYLLRVGKDGSGFEYHSYPDLSKEWELFTLLLRINSLKSLVDK